MNITISIPDEVVANAREYAKSHGTSLNQMIRDHLDRFSSDAIRRGRSKNAIAFFQSIVPILPKGAQITRDEMGER